MDSNSIIPDFAQPVREVDYPFLYSICTLVTRPDQYRDMLNSFVQSGFSPRTCEFLYADNTQGNRYEAFGAFNHFLRIARGKYIIVCHQDIELKFDTAPVLTQRLDELSSIDPKWALAGNAGGVNLKYRAAKLTHSTPPVFFQHGNKFPQKVQSLDENFIVVRNGAYLAVSSDLQGFHFYGPDICLLAKVLGYNAYVIDFHIYHKSSGQLRQKLQSA